MVVNVLAGAVMAIGIVLFAVSAACVVAYVAACLAAGRLYERPWNIEAAKFAGVAVLSLLSLISAVNAFQPPHWTDHSTGLTARAADSPTDLPRAGLEPARTFRSNGF